MGKLHNRLISQKREKKKRLRRVNDKDINAQERFEVVSNLRRRAGIRLVEPKSSQIPNCPHGPCLLFTNGKSKWFGCAVYRSYELCRYRVDVLKDETFDYEDAKPIKFKYGDGILSAMQVSVYSFDCMHMLPIFSGKRAKSRTGGSIGVKHVLREISYFTQLAIKNVDM